MFYKYFISALNNFYDLVRHFFKNGNEGNKSRDNTSFIQIFF